MPASSEPSSGATMLSAAVASPSGAHAQSGCARYALEAGWKLSGLIHSPSFIGAIAARTALNVASGKRGGDLPPRPGGCGGAGPPAPGDARPPPPGGDGAAPPPPGRGAAPRGGAAAPG